MKPSGDAPPSRPRPPGPRGTWLGGNLRDLRRDRLGFLTEVARTYGDVAAFRAGPRRIYLVSHPDAIEEVLVGQARLFTKHFALRLIPLVLGNGLLTSEGDFWLRQRRLMQPAFQRGKLARFGAFIVACAREVADAWPNGALRAILPDLMGLTLRIAARVLFGADATAQAQEVALALEVLQRNFLSRFNSLLPPPLWLPLPANLRLRRAVRRLDHILYDLIRQRRRDDSGAADVLSLLLQARSEEDGTGMTDRQLRDEAMTLFLAGHETTALALTWSCGLLGTHPQVQARLEEEVDQVLAGRDANADDLPALPYTQAVLLEAMRLYPPAYIVGREAACDCEVGGYRVPRGTTVLMSQWVVQRDDRFYKEPEAFRPERWLDGLASALPHYAYFPFGGGPRVCIGNTLAMMEMILVLATLARRVSFRLAAGNSLAVWPTFTLRPRDGVRAVITRREAPVAS